MRSNFLIWMGAALLTLIAIANNATFLADFKTGVLVGAGLVVFVLYPIYIRDHERRLAALENSDPLREPGSLVPAAVRFDAGKSAGSVTSGPRPGKPQPPS